MADKPMNQFTPASDCAYIYAEVADGSQVKISKQQLVDIVRPMLGITGMNFHGIVNDANQMTVTGIYQSQREANLQNMPEEDTSLTAVFSNGAYLIQINAGLNTNNFYGRTGILPNRFRTWIKLN